MTCSITFALFEFKVTYIVLSSEQAANIWYLDCCVSLAGDSSLMSVAASLPWCGASRDIWWGAGGWHLWWDKGHHSPLQLTLTSVITKPRISWLSVIEEGDTLDFRPLVSLCLLHWVTTAGRCQGWVSVSVRLITGCFLPPELTICG